MQKPPKPIFKMEISEKEQVSEESIKNELPDSWWYRVYFAVVIFTIFIISALAVFSWYFS
jgi:hypothetical protein